jgi:hypothetical protein
MLLLTQAAGPTVGAAGHQSKAAAQRVQQVLALLESHPKSLLLPQHPWKQGRMILMLMLGIYSMLQQLLAKKFTT